jgi:hypothetical protein
MKSIFRFLIIVSILLLGVDSIYAGGGNRTGTAGATQLLIPIGARGIALGGAEVATSTGIEALFWNPAGAAEMQNSATVAFSHMNYIADIGVEYGAVSANFEGFGIVSLNIKSLSVGDIPVTTTSNPDGTGQTYSPQELTIGVTYSRRLTDRIDVGVTTNFISETLGDVSASGVAFNAGVKYNNLADINGLNFGIVLKNIGPSMKFSGPGLLQKADVNNFNRPASYYNVDAASFELPSSFELGFGYRPVINDMNALQLSATFRNNNFSGDEYKFGAEYGYNNTFFLRGGYSMSPKSQSDEYIFGLTAGLGINYDLGGIDVKIDYAYRDVKYFNANHIFAISLGF